MGEIVLLKIKRQWFTNETTIGTLSIDGVHFCYTLEDVARAEGVKIPKITCIPAGEYDVIIDFSQRFQRLMPHILWVHNFDGVRIHMGNFGIDTEACPLVGFERGDNTIYKSKAAFAELFTRMTETIDKGEKIRLVITNEQIQ